MTKNLINILNHYVSNFVSIENIIKKSQDNKKAKNSILKK